MTPFEIALIIVGAVAFAALGLAICENSEPWGERVAKAVGAIMIAAGLVTALNYVFLFIAAVKPDSIPMF